MRNLLHIGLFALALTAVSQASADHERDRDEDRHDRHGARVIVTSNAGPHQVRTVRASVEPRRPIYESRRAFPKYANVMHEARRDYFEQRQDLEQITRIAESWDRASANRNRHAQSKVDRRLDAWLEREARESSYDVRNPRYTYEIRRLADELDALERRASRAHGHYDRGRYGHASHAANYRHGGRYGRGQRAYQQRKARILDELVALSERQFRRAEAKLQRPYRLSFARR